MFIILFLLLILMLLGAIVALEAKNLLSSIIALGGVGFGLVLTFLILQAPDLAIVQIVVETLSLIILIACILNTTSIDTAQVQTKRKIYTYAGGILFLVIFMFFANQAVQLLPKFGQPLLRMSEYYISQGLQKTGAANLVGGVILDFRAYDTLGEATVLFTAVIGVLVVLRRVGRRRTADSAERRTADSGENEI